MNILKSGTDPALKPDEELPAWLWDLAHPEKPLAELQRHGFTELQTEEVGMAVGSDGRQVRFARPARMSAPMFGPMP